MNAQRYRCYYFKLLCLVDLIDIIIRRPYYYVAVVSVFFLKCIVLKNIFSDIDKKKGFSEDEYYKNEKKFILILLNVT